MAAATAKHIEIVRSSRPWLNSLSQRSSDALLALLQRHYTHVGVTIVNDLYDLQRLVSLQPDLVFLGMKFVPTDHSLGRLSPRIWLSEYLDNHDIAYTGSNRWAHELEFDKSKAKGRVLEAGLTTSPFHVVRQTDQLVENDIHIEFPLFVKPTDRGGGLGIDSDSVVKDFDALRAKVHSIATRYGSDALVEQYLPGREFSVAILKDTDSDAYTAMPIELIVPADDRGLKLLSSNVKSNDRETAVAVMDLNLKSQVETLALDVFSALGARDYGRIDIRLDADGTPHFLEANLIPSLIAGYGSFPKASMINCGLDYEQMILKIVSLGLTRQYDLADTSALSLRTFASIE